MFGGKQKTFLEFQLSTHKFNMYFET